MRKNRRRSGDRIVFGVKGVVTPLMLPDGLAEEESNALHEVYEVLIKNISARGAFLARKPPLPIGTFLRIDFDLGDQAFHTFGRVVRIAEGNEPCGNGVRLVFVEDKDRLVLLKYLASQLESLKP